MTNPQFSASTFFSFGAVIADDPQDLPAAEQVDDASRGNADMSIRGVKKRKRRSKAWENFNVIEEDQEENPLKAECKHCLTHIKCAAKDGTSGMLNHNKVCQKKHGANNQPPNPSSASNATETASPIVIADSSGGRRRQDEESAQIIVANTYIPWEKVELSNRFQKITSQLQNVYGEVSEILKLHGPDSASSSNQNPNTTSDHRLRTSSLVPRQVYGRVAEKDSIKNLILEDKSDGVRVLPIVGIAGVGKTALAQFVYNHPEVKSKFQHRIWLCVSHNFDEVRLTREMLDFLSQENHEGICSFAKLQEILKSHANSKKFLLIFDDVWDDMKDFRWDKLLAPFASGQGNGIVVLVTTRNLSVAKRLGTLKPVKLSALENDDFWLLFKSRAFGDGNYEGPRSLSTIGRKIAEKLKGNPLAAVSVGAILREHLTVDHWSNILEKEYWKSLGLSEGIMPALKLSYDHIPYHLQQCWSYGSIFPNKHKFLAKDLVYIWISQGFVNSTCLTKRLEETGWEYLTDLVNLGFFQQVEQEELLSPDSQIWYSACGLMHDFAKIVSRTECATIDGLKCNKMLPSIHHLSIVTDSAYNSKDLHGSVPRNKKFEENLRNTVTSVSKLRTLVLLGHYDSFFLQLFKDIFRKAENLRLLQMSATCADFNSLTWNLLNPAHLRYLKFDPHGMNGSFPQSMRKLYHLQVLDVGSEVYYPHGINNLVSLRHLVGNKGMNSSSIDSIGNMTALQELHEFTVNLWTSGLAPLQSMNELVQLGLSGLGNVQTRKEARGACLRDKVHLEKLHLSWKDSLFGYLDETATDIAREVLEGLEPHMDLKHLQISGYVGTTSPTWLASNIAVTSLQTLHLDGCGGWTILPSLESFPFLTKLKLSSMPDVMEVLVPSLEELVLIQMPKLVRCSSTSVEGLSSSLRVLQIEYCEVLKEFDLFENDDGFEIKQRSWLPGLRKLILRDCPHLKVWRPLPPSTTCFELLIHRVSALSSMEGSASGKLQIGLAVDKNIDNYSYELRILNGNFLAFHNLRNLKSMSIVGSRNVTSISFKGFSHLVSLKSLEISMCEQLFYSDVMPEHTLEDVTGVNWKAFPCLESLSIKSCGIAGKWLSLLLRHAAGLRELHLEEEIEEGYSSSGNHGLVHIPSNSVSSLKKVTIRNCPRLTFNWGEEEGFSGFTSLHELEISGCPKLLSSLVHKDGNDLTSLKRLVVHSISGLESLQLHTCKGLEELKIEECDLLTALEGLQSLGSLRHLAVSYCPGLHPCLESLSRQGHGLCSRLETLEITDPSVLTASFCKRLTSLRRLKLKWLVLTEEQGRTIVFLKSLQQLEFNCCHDLLDLPAGLHHLPTLKWLKIYECRQISRLPEGGLPLSLEELKIFYSSKKLADQCTPLATSKLNVKIVSCTF